MEEHHRHHRGLFKRIWRRIRRSRLFPQMHRPRPYEIVFLIICALIVAAMIIYYLRGSEFGTGEPPLPQ
jgi:hypothetical protein